MKKINITETVLRDANQSLIATRMPFNDFEGILEKIDQAGYYSIECWGGATFDSCLRYLSEDPWERLRKIKAKVKNTKLQMLLRGQNLLGYKHYPDDVVRKFVEHSIKNGIDIIRIFDALNDFRNIQVAVEETLKHGGHAQGAICYTISPIHNLESYVKMAKELESMGVNSICVKDMAGIMSPKEAYDLFKALSETVKVPLVLHTHSTTGLAPMTYLKAIEAGCTGPYVLGTETDALTYQIPGGMLSNLIAQLKQQNALDKLDEVLQETPRVRKDLGYPPLVTPMSQMVGVQAAMNVLLGERYKNVSKEVKAYIKGEYGKAPGEIDPELIKKVLGDEKPITNRYADNLEPEFEKTKQQLGNLAKSDEDVLSYIAFPQIAEKFLREREEKKAATVSYSIRKVG